MSSLIEQKKTLISDRKMVCDHTQQYKGTLETYLSELKRTKTEEYLAKKQEYENIIRMNRLMLQQKRDTAKYLQLILNKKQKIYRRLKIVQLFNVTINKKRLILMLQLQRYLVQYNTIKDKSTLMNYKYNQMAEKYNMIVQEHVEPIILASNEMNAQYSRMLAIAPAKQRIFVLKYKLNIMKQVLIRRRDMRIKCMKINRQFIAKKSFLEQLIFNLKSKKVSTRSREYLQHLNDKLFYYRNLRFPSKTYIKHLIAYYQLHKAKKFKEELSSIDINLIQRAGKSSVLTNNFINILKNQLIEKKLNLQRIQVQMQQQIDIIRLHASMGDFIEKTVQQLNQRLNNIQAIKQTAIMNLNQKALQLRMNQMGTMVLVQRCYKLKLKIQGGDDGCKSDEQSPIDIAVQDICRKILQELHVLIADVKIKRFWKEKSLLEYKQCVYNFYIKLAQYASNKDHPDSQRLELLDIINLNQHIPEIERWQGYIEKISTDATPIKPTNMLTSTPQLLEQNNDQSLSKSDNEQKQSESESSSLEKNQEVQPFTQQIEPEPEQKPEPEPVPQIEEKPEVNTQSEINTQPVISKEPEVNQTKDSSSVHQDDMQNYFDDDYYNDAFNEENNEFESNLSSSNSESSDNSSDDDSS